MYTEKDYIRLYDSYQEAVSEIRRLNAIVEEESKPEKMSDVWARHIEKAESMIAEVERYIEASELTGHFGLMKQLKIHAGKLIDQKASMQIAYLRCLSVENNLGQWMGE